jgi:hypothetical protein
MSAVPPTTTETPKKDAAVVDPAADGTKPATLSDKLAIGASLTGVGLLIIFPIVFAILFHFGAAYLSYQKYGSILWSILDFIFAVFYYPFYAFFLAKDPGPSMGMVGGRRRRH